MSESPQGIGAGSSTSDWRDTIQDESLRQDPTILNIKASDPNEAINALSQQLVHSQKLIGGEKILRPKEDWEPQQLRDWKNEVLNVPKSVEEYQLSEFKAPEGMHIPEDLQSNFIKEVADPLELTDAQASKIFQNMVDSNQLQTQTQETATRETAEKQLLQIKEKWGDKYDANMEIVEYGLKSVAPESLVEQITNDPVLSTNPDLIETFHKVGQMLQSDNPAGLKEKGAAPLGNKASALQRIQELEGSSDWLKYIQPKTLLTPTEQMHKQQLLEERSNLYAIAYAEE
jgi:hypothetical protein